MAQWRCTACGTIVDAAAMPESCAVCGRTNPIRREYPGGVRVYQELFMKAPSVAFSADGPAYNYGDIPEELTRWRLRR